MYAVDEKGWKITELNNKSSLNISVNLRPWNAGSDKESMISHWKCNHTNTHTHILKYYSMNTRLGHKNR